VSSVISDFIASGKPYLVANPGSATDFVQRYPTVAGGYLLQPGDRLAGILEELRAPGPDRMAPHREMVRQQLLGPASPYPLAGFIAAVDALVDPSVRSAIPAPRDAGTVPTSLPS
jgi:hypothetical protein